MHWTPEHAQPLNQWPEQHLDVSSTTPSPAHKLELPPGSRQRCHYAWAHDDISALTASNLLKRYAEKYSGVLDSPYERPALGGYSDAAFLNGAKGDPDPWPGPEPPSPYPLASLHDGLPGTKPGSGSGGLGGSPVVAGNLPEPLYAGNACGGPSAAPEYPAGYGGGYLTPGYCAQTGAALAPPPPAALLQPPPPPGYAPSAAPLYNYPAGGYTTQPGYGALPPPPAAPPAPYLPSGLAAPTPLPAPAPASYGFPAAAEAGVSLKRKAADEGAEARYRKYVYEPAKAPAADGASYPAADNGECRGNGFRAKAPGTGAAEEASGKYGGGVPVKVLGSPVYGPQLEPFDKFSSDRAPVPAARGAFAVPSGEPPQAVDPGALELVTSKMVDCGPPVQWVDVAGQGAVKAALEEELVWPLLRPPAYPGSSRPPRTVLLFGPRGAGKALLGRCLATQLGATLLRLRGTSVAAPGAAEGARLLQAAFAAARCRPPAVLLISELEALLPARDDGGGTSLQAPLLACLDGSCGARADGVLVVGTTSRPAALDEATRRRFSLRLYVALPDSPARGQILQRALAQQGCALSERELAALVQGTQGFSGGELGQLCQQAAAGAGLPGLQRPISYKDLEAALAKVGPRASPKELDSFLEWDKMYGSGH